MRLGLLWLGCMMFSLRCIATQPAADDLTLQAMCQHGMTESAILFATEQRKRVAEEPEPYARWTQRLIECEAQAAVRSDKEADVHWKRCSELVDEFTKRHPQDRRLPWIQWQSIRCDLLLAQDFLARWLAAPANKPLREQSLERVRKILERLTELEDDLKVRQPLAAKQGPNDRRQAPPEQISQLRLDVVLMRCEAFLIRARLYESGSRDRVASVTNVEAEAGGLLDRTSKEWATRASLEVARATAWLDLDRRDEAIALLQSVVLNAASASDRIRAAVTASDALTTEGKLSQARAFVDLLKTIESGPEWEMAELRLSLKELSSLPPERKEAEIAKLLVRAKSIGERFGDYWRARADSILTNSVSSADAGAGSASELVVVEVRQLLAAGDEATAIEKLVTTSRNELASGRAASAVRFATQASALLQRQQDYLAAADAAEEITEQAPEIDGAAAGHLSAAWNLSQALRVTPQDKQLRERYTQVLRDHLRLWPNAPTAEQATNWLQSWLVASGQQDELLAVFRNQAQQATAPEKARDGLYSWLAIVMPSNQRKEELKSMQQALSDGQLRAVDGSARIAILAAQCIPEWADDKNAKRLQAEASELVGQAATATDRQLLAAAYLLLAARAGDASVALGTASVWNSSSLKPEMIEPLAAAIIDTIDAWPSKEQPEWASKIKFTEEQIQSLISNSRLTAQAIGWRMRGLQAADTKTSLENLRALIKQNEKLGSLRLQLANALAKQDATALRESTDIARRLAANSPQASELYYGARWRLIRNQQLEGKPAEAEKAAKLILATISDEAVSWRVRFAKLIER